MSFKLHENDTMLPRERVEAVLSIKEPDRVPVVAAFHCAPALLTGITIEEFFFDISKSFEASKKVWELTGGFDVFGGISPILGYYAPFPNSHSMFYFDWTFPKGNISEQMNEREIMKREDYDHLIEKGYSLFRRKDRKLQKELTKILRDYAALDIGGWHKEKGLMALAHGYIEPPVDIISFLRSFNKFLTDVVEIPEKLVEACDATTDEMLKSLDGQLQLLTMGGHKGPKLVLFGFSRIATNLISSKKFELFWPHIKKISDYIIKKGCIVQYHIDNDYTDVLEYFTEFPKGKTMFHLDLTDIFKAKEILGDRACLMGNLPPQITGLGSPKEVEDYCKKQIEGCKEGGGYMLCSACVLPDNISLANLKAMRDSVMKYGFYKA